MQERGGENYGVFLLISKSDNGALSPISVNVILLKPTLEFSSDSSARRRVSRDSNKNNKLE